MHNLRIIAINTFFSKFKEFKKKIQARQPTTQTADKSRQEAKAKK
jgi:hypothetical protein